MIARRVAEETIDFRRDEEVLVYQGEQKAVKQPRTFQFCPLGVQLYTEAPVKECTLMDLTLSLPAEHEPERDEIVHCTGLVAQCCAAEGGQKLYRVWVKFIDLPENLAERIRAFTQHKRLTCPFCQNF